MGDTGLGSTVAREGADAGVTFLKLPFASVTGGVSLATSFIARGAALSAVMVCCARAGTVEVTLTGEVSVGGNISLTRISSHRV